ncbi:hypothetical protein N431DRAFT_502064 [Stipitochalara longipes BDJ]|nr:hypothetical protein N431DRAFT_502064 [Stipitochalara longipes BDJ]
MSSSKGPLFLPPSSDGLRASYPPFVAGLGGSPTKDLDDPATAVFLVLFIIGAVSHMTILQVNLRRGKKFIISGLLFGFCMARITTMTMRLVWFRACHPNLAWARWFSLAFKVYYMSIIAMLIVPIFCTVQSFYTLEHNIRRINRDIQLVGSTYFAVAAFLPIPLVLLRLILPKESCIEEFGEGRFRTKIYILLFSSVILTLGAAFRAGISYVPKPRADPAWYHSKAYFYIFNFTIEIIVVILYAIMRVDKRFHVPNGSHAPGDYSSGNKEELERKPSFAERVLKNEEQVFDEPEKRLPDLEAGLKPVAEEFHKEEDIGSSLVKGHTVGVCELGL